MIINNHDVANITIAAYDGCHKIYIPVKGQEEIFMKDFETRGWTDEDFYKINSVEDLMNMYIDSCPLRFIQQLDCSGEEDQFIDIIPQCSFIDDEFFDEDLARKAFVQPNNHLIGW
jgi:hypothetical protein